MSQYFYINKQIGKKQQKEIDEMFAEQNICWYTGLPCTEVSHNISLSQFEGNEKKLMRHLQAKTKEHLIPQHLELRKIFTTLELYSLNIVPATRLVNTMIGDAPLSIKFEFRDELKSDLDFSGGVLLKEHQVGIKKCRDRVFGRYRVAGHPVWTRSGYSNDSRYKVFSMANPVMTPNILDQKNRVLNKILIESDKKFTELFGTTLDLLFAAQSELTA